MHLGTLRSLAFALAGTLFAGPLALSAMAQTPAPPSASPIDLTIDAHAPTTPFPHFWEKTFGSGRAILALRSDYRSDLHTVKQATDFQSIRFHGILDDEVGVYDPARQTKNPGLDAQAANDASIYNFFYLDEIYDGLLAEHVKPYVEISFMPEKLASKPHSQHTFTGNPNNSPPKDYAIWDAMMKALATHLIARYGIEEVATWKFEVWNEPNLDFWMGDPKQETYFKLYDHTAHDLKSVSPRLQVGGPATAQAAWVTPFLAHVKAVNAPIDFVSTHVYANDTAKDVFHTDEQIPRDLMVYRAVKHVHEEVLASPYPHLPLIFSEYNASYANEPNVTDTPFIGAWLANNIRLCDGLTDSMDYWSFSDVFDEQGVVRTPFYGGFGLIAAESIPKAALNDFRALHQLGDQRIALDSDSALATKTADGKLVLALYDYAPPTGTGPDYTWPKGPAGPPKTFTLTLQHVPSNASVEVLRVDDDHGNGNKAFDAMGRPPGDLMPAQVDQLRAAGAMAPAEHLHLHDGKLTLTVPAHGLAVVLIGK
jgi:xylan 1,4-beta-xylosidase